MRIVFYGRTQVGSVVLSYLVAKGHEVKIIPEDEIIKSLGNMYGLEEVTFKTMEPFDVFVSCHGEKFVPNTDRRYINMHSCLWKYKGKDPISRYIANKDTDASIESHFMTDKFDEGEVINRQLFKTPVVKTHGEYFNLALPHYYKCIDETLKRFNKNLAVTRYRDNPERLEAWLRYYSKNFDDIVVFAFGTRGGEMAQLNEKYKFVTILDPGTDIYSDSAHQQVWDFINKSYDEYNWIFYSDIDELVVPNPLHWKSLKDFMQTCTQDTMFAEGWEVVMSGSGEDFDWSKSVTSQRNLWVRDVSGSYNKPVLTRVPVSWNLGFHSLDGVTADEIKAKGMTGLYLFHLKHVNNKDIPSTGFYNGCPNYPYKREIPKMFEGII